MPFDNEENVHIENLSVLSHSKHTRHKYINKRNFTYIFVILLALSLFGIGILYLYDKKENNKATIATNCSDRSDGSVLNSAKIIFKDSSEPATIDSVNELIIKIKEVENYEDDANCLYPIMYSYIIENDFKTAKTEFEKFASIYGDGSTFAKDIYPMQDIEEFKKLIEFSLNIQSDDKIVPTPRNIMTGGIQDEEAREDSLSR